MPKHLKARPPQDDREGRKVRRLAGARHAPAGWTELARIVALSWDGQGVATVASARPPATVRPQPHMPLP
jgi:hypothetical protein